MVLNVMCNNGDVGHKMMASKMKRKFDKYWGNINNINCLLFIATILDPRCKLVYVNLIVNEVYEMEKASELMAKVRKILEDLYDFYNAILPHTESHKSAAVVEDVENVGTNVDVMLKSLHKRLKIEKGTMDSKNELDKYLEEDCEDEDDTSFNVLEWWKSNSSKYKVLSSIARDVLAIPVSTVASESAFSTGGRVLDPFRSSLTPRMVEALICGQDWFRRSHEILHIEEDIAALESMESESCMTDDHQILSIDED